MPDDLPADLTALRELLAKVEAGKTPEAREITSALRPVYDGDEPIVAYFRMACDENDIRGMGAARALHESMLPWWGYQVSPQYAIVIDPASVHGIPSRSKDAISESGPARAWIIAITRALIAQEEGGE